MNTFETSHPRRISNGQIVELPSSDHLRAPYGIQHLLKVLMRRRKWVIGATVFGVVLAIVLTLLMRPVYQGTATIELNKAGGDSLDLSLGDVMGQQLDSQGEGLQTDLQTETAILKGDSLALEVIQRLGLESQPPFVANGQRDPEQGLPLAEAPHRRSRLLAIFEKGLNVAPVHGTRLIQVSYRSHDPKQAANIANALVDCYKSQYLQEHYQATSEASDWLTKQLSDLKTNVEESEKRLTDFERQSGIISLQGIGSATNGEPGTPVIHSVVIQRLDELNSELTTAEANRIEKEAIYQLAKGGDGDAIASLASNPLAVQSNSAVLTEGGGLSALQGLKQKQNDLKVTLAAEATTYGPNNRHLKELQTQIQEVGDQIHQEIGEIIKRASADLQLAEQSEEAVRQQFEKQQSEASKLNEKAVEFAILSQEATSRKKLYEDLYTKLQEANVSAGIKATNITVVDPARWQAIPIRPKPTSNVFLGLLLGLFSGIGLAFLVESLDGSVVNYLEVEEITGMPVIGIIPTFELSTRAYGNGRIIARSLKKKRSVLETQGSVPKPIWLLDHPQSVAAEAFRSLHTSVILSRPGGGPQVIVLTSCIPGEGKSTLAVNLALTFAQYGKKVVLVEADMRRPSLNRVLSVPDDSGLSSILSGVHSADQATIRSIRGTTLDAIPAGPHPPLPSVLLGSQAFNNLVAHLRSEYDLVLIDSPPALLLSDAISISSQSDATIWVVQAGAITRQYLHRAALLISRNAVPVVGFVLNKTNKNVDPYGYSYGYGYGYGDKLYGHYFAESVSNDNQ